ncbi:MAG TPA: hypothetical protein VL527_09050 [Dongiaceae bacterium]|nr:hypothetical protein [Dongiaceae bacterium]
MPRVSRKKALLRGARVYLSGPMDYVASRAAERQSGWRNRVSQFLELYGVTVFDPWYKPGVRGLHRYGREDAKSGERIRARWTYARGKKGAQQRAWCARQFWETLHIDLRMVDTSDFSVSYVPTNIYSVGTPHEIIMATLQHKPVLFVSPPVVFPTLHELRQHLKNDPAGTALLHRLENEIPIKENPKGIPSLWYIPLVGGENFFDGFGFAPYRKRFGWTTDIPIDEHEKAFPPQRPLLPFLEKLNHRLPKKWDRKRNRFEPDDDWLLWDFQDPKPAGKSASPVWQSPRR